jgi:hypothetical protein
MAFPTQTVASEPATHGRPVRPDRNLGFFSGRGTVFVLPAPFVGPGNIVRGTGCGSVEIQYKERIKNQITRTNRRSFEQFSKWGWG